MEQFQPMMTSEPRQPQHAPAVLVTSARTRRPRGKRECAVEELDEEGVRVPRKRERRWGLANNSYFSCISLYYSLIYSMPENVSTRNIPYLLTVPCGPNGDVVCPQPF